MHHPYIGGERHDFKEDKGGKKVRREKYALRCAKCQQEKQIVAVPVSVVSEVFSGKEGGHKPHKGGNSPIQRAETV